MNSKYAFPCATKHRVPVSFGGSHGAGCKTVDQKTYHQGMTLRDWYAGQALIGIISSGGAFSKDRMDEAGELAYQHADSMMKARGGK